MKVTVRIRLSGSGGRMIDSGTSSSKSQVITRRIKDLINFSNNVAPLNSNTKKILKVWEDYKRLGRVSKRYKIEVIKNEEE